MSAASYKHSKGKKGYQYIYIYIYFVVVCFLFVFYEGKKSFFMAGVLN